MKVTIISSSPNKEGLTAACCNAAKMGVEEACGEFLHIDLNASDLNRCRICGNGWGTCRSGHCCETEDDFEQIHSEIADSDAFVFITPVYWGEMSETAKLFFDKVRRCEALKREGSLFYGKPVLTVAAAGGSGNGTLSCLESMERLSKHMGATIFDLISITQKSRLYKIDAIKAGVKAMCDSIKK